MPVPFDLYNDQIRQDNTRGGGACTLGSATPPILRAEFQARHFWKGVAVFMPTPFKTERLNLAG